MIHKTYLVLGISPKFHIESLGRTFVGGTHTLGILMLNAPRGTLLRSKKGHNEISPKQKNKSSPKGKISG